MDEEQIAVSGTEYESLPAAKDDLLPTNARLVQNLEAQLRLARKQCFGSKSEKSKYDD